MMSVSKICHSYTRKIADKTCNVRDVASRPPANWDESRRREYFDWAEKVVDGCRGANGALEACFDQSLAAGRRT